jgi:hypothetical protein
MDEVDLILCIIRHKLKQIHLYALAYPIDRSLHTYSPCSTNTTYVMHYSPQRVRNLRIQHQILVAIYNDTKTNAQSCVYTVTLHSKIKKLLHGITGDSVHLTSSSVKKKTLIRTASILTPIGFPCLRKWQGFYKLSKSIVHSVSS